MKTLEELLKTEGATKFNVRVEKTFDRGVLFKIYPTDAEGPILDFMVSDNLLTDPKGGRLKRLAE